MPIPRFRVAGRALTLATLAVLALSAPAAANTVDRFSFQDVWVDTFSCGVTITTEVSARGTAHLDEDGWRFTTMHFHFAGTAIDPDTGASLRLDGRQIVREEPGKATSTGQGWFWRVPSRGVVLHDVGRLVFDPSDGSTLEASARVIRFDDPTADARVDAAACSLFD